MMRNIVVFALYRKYQPLSYGTCTTYSAATHTYQFLFVIEYNENKEGLQQLLELRTFTNNDILLLYPEDEDVISIAASVASWITLKLGRIKGQTIFPKDDRRLWYTASTTSRKSLEANLS
nr:replication protein A 70 kDa DNA-binding subunit B-like isoform X2 [Tanacetum cinerariifolium]